MNKVEKNKLIKKLKEIGYNRIDNIVQIFIEEFDIAADERIATDEEEYFKTHN